jgi:hypothetical protein
MPYWALHLAFHAAVVKDSRRQGGRGRDGGDLACGRWLVVWLFGAAIGKLTIKSPVMLTAAIRLKNRNHS